MTVLSIFDCRVRMWRKYQTWIQSPGNCRKTYGKASVIWKPWRSTSLIHVSCCGWTPGPHSYLASALNLNNILAPIFTFYFEANVSLYSPDSSWTCGPPVSAASVTEIKGLCQWAHLYLILKTGKLHSCVSNGWHSCVEFRVADISCPSRLVLGHVHNLSLFGGVPSLSVEDQLSLVPRNSMVYPSTTGRAGRGLPWF